MFSFFHICCFDCASYCLNCNHIPAILVTLLVKINGFSQHWQLFGIKKYINAIRYVTTIFDVTWNFLVMLWCGKSNFAFQRSCARYTSRMSFVLYVWEAFVFVSHCCGNLVRFCVWSCNSSTPFSFFFCSVFKMLVCYFETSSFEGLMLPDYCQRPRKNNNFNERIFNLFWKIWNDIWHFSQFNRYI